MAADAPTLTVMVTRCDHCPAESQSDCGLVGDSIDFDEDTPPDWCPLREGPVTLRLR